MRRFGADLAAERTATFAESFNDMSSPMHLVFDELDGAVLVAENNGWEGSRPEIVEAVSQGCRLTSIYWSVNADMIFTHAEDGVTVACFDPLLIEHPWLGTDPESIREQARDLRFGVKRARSDSLALLQRLTGLRLERSWLEEPHRCVDTPGDMPPTVPSVEDYSSFVREALRQWWREFRRGRG